MASFQNLEGIEPHPTIPGASLVRFRDGSTMPAPQAIASQFDPRLTAPGSPALVQAGSGFYAPAAPQKMSLSAPAPAPAPEAPAQPVLAREAPRAPLADTDSGLPVDSLQRIYAPVRVGARQAYDPTADDASRRAVRENQTEQRQGVQYWDDEERTSNLLDRREAISAQAEAERLRAESALEAQRLQANQLQRAAQDQAAKQAADEAAWAQENTRLTNEAKAVASKEINPNRVFSEKGPFQIIGLAIAAGFKGFASRGQDTSIADTINRIVDRDIAVQQDALQSQKASADNALARNVQRYGSIEAGRAATKAAMMQAALANFDETRARLGMPAQEAQIEAQRKQLEAAAYDQFSQLRAAAQGTVNTATASRMVAPVKASAGYLRAPTEAEIDRRFQREQGIAERGATIIGKRLANNEKLLSNEYLAKNGMTLEQAAAQAKDRTTQVNLYGQRRDATEAAQAKLERFRAENGIKTDPDGNLVVPSDIAGFGRVVSKLPEGAVTQQGVNNRAAIEGIVYDSVRSAFGAANDKQVEMITDRIIGSGSISHIVAQLNQLQHELRAQRDNLAGSFDPEVVTQYERNKGVARAKADTKSKFFEPVNVDAK